MTHPKNPASEFQASTAGPQRNRRQFLLPRQHGAWGMVSLPFIAGALVAGGWANPRTLAAALAVLSAFVLSAPVLALWRSRAARAQRRGAAVPDRARSEIRNARFSLAVDLSVAAVAAGYLLLHMPLVPWLIMGAGAAVLMAVVTVLAARNYQRYPALQIASAIGLTASALPAYWTARGHLDTIAFWVWALCAAQSAASVLVVHARLEALISSRKPMPVASTLPHRRDALAAQAGLVLLLGFLAIQGRSWWVLPFLPACLLNWWDLWRLKTAARHRVSMQRVGLMQLGASIAFCILLVAVLRP